MSSAQEMAERIGTAVLDSIRGQGWTATWSDCNGFKVVSVDPRIRVWLDGYIDRDYEEVFLLRVWTDIAGADTFVTITDHLAVFDTGEGITAAWRDKARLFYEADREWGHEGLRWWVNWIMERDLARHYSAVEGLTPEQRAFYEAHTREIIQDDRDSARAIGVSLPYLEGQ